MTRALPGSPAERSIRFHTRAFPLRNVYDRPRKAAWGVRWHRSLWKGMAPRRQAWGREEKPLSRKSSLSPMPLCPFKALPPTFPENRLRPTSQKAKMISPSTLSAPPSANAPRPHANVLRCSLPSWSAVVLSIGIMAWFGYHNAKDILEQELVALKK